MKRVVVIGAGMVGARFADDLLRADRHEEFEVHLLGSEVHPPYNRILLTELLAGRCDLASLSLPVPDSPRLRLHTGVTVDHVDRTERVVHSDLGPLAYDHVVWATGARPRVPPIDGLDGSMPRGVHALRSVDDSREVLAATLNARTAVVVGAGPLGLESACALRKRGLDVHVIHMGEAIMDRYLDADAADVLAAVCGDLGITVHERAHVTSAAFADDQLESVTLDGGWVIDAELLVLACGVLPEAAAAQASGLAVGRGIVVDAEMRSATDPSHWAIGDCAEGPDGCSGLVAPGWEHSRRVAATLVGRPPEPAAPPSAAPMRLKAVGVNLVTMGLRGSEVSDDEHRVVTVHDPRGRRHLEVVVRGQELVGATALGTPDVAADLASRFGRATPLPSDPLMLLTSRPGAAVEPTSPTTMPSATTVCRCNGVTKKDLVTAWENGACDVPAMAGATRATTGCGGCRGAVAGIVEWLQQSDSAPISQAARGEREGSVPAPKPPARVLDTLNS